MSSVYNWPALIVALAIVLYFGVYLVDKVQTEVEKCEKDPDCELKETLNYGQR